MHELRQAFVAALVIIGLSLAAVVTVPIAMILHQPDRHIAWILDTIDHCIPT